MERDLKGGVPRTFTVVVPAEAAGAQAYFSVGSGACANLPDFQDCSFDAPRQFTLSVVGLQGQAAPPVNLSHEEFSAVNGLTPGVYHVTVTPTAGVHLVLYGGFW